MNSLILLTRIRMLKHGNSFVQILEASKVERQLKNAAKLQELHSIIIHFSLLLNREAVAQIDKDSSVDVFDVQKSELVNVVA